LSTGEDSPVGQWWHQAVPEAARNEPRPQIR
jgi:hypothetical protein